MRARRRRPGRLHRVIRFEEVELQEELSVAGVPVGEEAPLALVHREVRDLKSVCVCEREEERERERELAGEKSQNVTLWM